MSLAIRPETPRDQPAVQALLEAAFGGSDEARLVARLRREAQPLVSLVAERDGKIIGHILFSPLQLPQRPEGRMMSLAPLAVAPSEQRRGVGAALVRAGLDACRALGCAGVIVLGHPAYYPRFGFAPASRFGIACPFAAPDEAFMALALGPGGLEGPASGVVYPAAFQEH